MSLRPSSVTIAVIITLVGVTTLTLLVAGAVNYDFLKRREVELVRQSLILDADQLSPSLALPVWNFDHPQIERVVESMMRDPILVGIIVSSPDGKGVICARMRDGHDSVTELDDGEQIGLLKEERDIRFANETIATARLFATTESVEEQMKSNRTFVAKNIFWLDLVLLFGSFVLLRAWVFKPLQAVEAYAAAVSTGGAPPEVGRFHGELERLRLSIKRMFELLNARYLELLTSEEKFAKAFRANPISLVILEMETGRYIEVNESFCRTFGFSPAEVIGRTSVELGICDGPEELKRIVQPLQVGTALRSLVLEVKTHEGKPRTVSINAERIELGGKWCAVLLIDDVTERGELERKQAELAAIVESTKDGIIGNSLTGIITSWNRGAETIFGYAAAEVVGKPMQMLLPPERWQEEEAILTGIARGETAEHLETVRLRKDGRQITIAATISPLEDGNGRVIGAAKIVRDITEQKRNEARLRRLSESEVQGVIFWNIRGRITQANDTFLKTVGYTREDLAAGRLNWLAMTPPEYEEVDERAQQEFVSRGVCQQYEKEFYRKDGTRVPVLLGGAMFGDTTDEGVSFVVDLSERKKLEQQLLRSQRMESIGTLAGGIAHDLNNVLGPIMMSLAVLEMRFPDSDSREILSILHASAQRGADMVRQVLSFARGMEGRRMEVQVNHLVKDIGKIAQDTFLKHIQIRTVLPHTLWTVLGDPTQIHQVLLNLCVNARDAMPHGGALTLSAENVTLDEHYAGLEPEAKPGPYICLQVEDSGTGMKPEVLEKIFDPFFTTKEIGKGTGLGLSTTLAIVKSHGGFLRVYSELGKGTKFRVYLPAKPEATLEESTPAPTEMPQGHGELVLVVDDEYSVRQITQQTLESFGYRVLTANDGAEALAQFGSRGPEIAVVLTDMMMPEMNGLATISVLRKLAPSVPIIAASGLSSSGYATQVAAFGVKHFLAKPYTAETLLKTLDEVLREGKKGA